MRKINFFSLFIPIAGLLIVAPWIDNYNLSFLSRKGVIEKDILFKTIGEAKILLSDVSYITADIYFHGGRGGFTEEEKCISHPDEHHKHVHEHIPAPKFNLLARLAQKLEFHEHRHLSGEEGKEALPWFYYAAKLNPHNIDAYVVGAYWVGSQLDRPDDGIRFLKEGLRHNPDSWKIHAEIGNLYSKKKGDYKKAITYYETARSLITWEDADKYDRRTVLTFLAACYEKAGDNLKAIDIYKEILKDFPGNEALKQKIKDLTIIIDKV